MDKQVNVILRVTASGTEVIDATGQKLGTLAKTAEESAGHVNRGFGALIGGVSALGVVAAGVAATMKTINDAANFDKIARGAGISAAELTSYSLAVRQADTDLQSFGRGLAPFNKALVDASTGTGANARLLAALGVTAHDTLPALGQLADAFAKKLPDGTEKSLVAYKLFQDQAPAFIALLDQGSAAIEEQRRRAEQLGVTYGEDFVRESKEAKKNIDELKLAFEGLENTLAVHLGPTAVSVTGWLRNVAVEGAAAVRRVSESGAEWVSGLGGNQVEQLPGKITEDFWSAQTPGAPGGDALRRNIRNILGNQQGASAADASARKATAEAQRRADAELNDLEKARLALFDAEKEKRAQLLSFAEQDLELAKARGATDADLFALARKVDQERTEALEQQRAGLEKQRDLIADSGVIQAKDLDQWVNVNGQIDLTNAALERYRAGVGSVVSELQRQRDVVIDIRDVASEAQRRVIDGVLNSGGKFDASQILKGTLSTVESDLVNGLIQANGRGGELVVKGWEDAGRGIIDTFRQTFGQAESVLAQFSARAGGILRNIPILGRFLDSVSNKQATFGSTPGQSPSTVFNEPGTPGTTNIPGLGAINNDSLKAAQNAGLISAGTASSIGEIAGLAGIALAAVQIITSDIQGQKAGIKEARGDAFKRGRTAEDLSGDLGAGGIAGGIWAGILGKKLGGEFNLAMETGGWSTFLDAVGISLIQPKTGGTITKAQISKALEDANLPRQREFSAGGRTGVRIPFFETPLNDEDLAILQRAGWTQQGGTLANVSPGKAAAIAANAQPGVRGLIGTAALGLGTVIGDNQTIQFNAISTLTNNLSALGVSEKEARRELLALASSMHIDLVSGINDVNKKYLEGVNTQQQAISAIAGLADLFGKDLPAGIDLSAIAMKDFSVHGGEDIATFTEDVDKAVKKFGALKDAEERGLLSGSNSAIAAYAQLASVRDSFMYGGGATASDYTKAVLNARASFVEPLTESLRTGVLDALSQGALDAAKNTLPWQALQQAIAGAVGGAVDPAVIQRAFSQGFLDAGQATRLILGVPDASAIGDLAGYVADSLDPLFQHFGDFYDALNKSFGLSPFGLQQAAGSIRDTTKNIQFNALSPKSQLSSIRGDISSTQAEIAAAIAAGADPATLLPLYQQLGAEGNQYAAAASSVYRGSRLRSQQGYGYGIAEQGASGIERLGGDPNSSPVDKTASRQLTATNTLNDRTKSLSDRMRDLEGTVRQLIGVLRQHGINPPMAQAPQISDEEFTARARRWSSRPSERRHIQRMTGLRG